MKTAVTVHSRTIDLPKPVAFSAFGRQQIKFCGAPCARAAVRVQRGLAHKAVATMEEVSVSSLDEELDQSSLYTRFDSLISNFAFAYKPGDKVTGVVFRVDGRGAYVDIGAKGAAFCPAAEASMCKLDKVLRCHGDF